MPRGDGTGPYGTGPVGWGLGPCGRGLRRVARPYGYYGMGRRMGAGYGAGYGRGMGMGYFAGAPYAVPVQPVADDRSWLQAEAQRLEALLADVRSELGQISAERDLKDPE